jgi:cell division transport system ATP-binding protein
LHCKFNNYVLLFYADNLFLKLKSGKMEKPLIELRNSSIYQHDTVILSEIDLQLFPGEFVYLIGKTGSGKSSLLRTLYGDLPLKKGNGVVSGFELESLKEKDIPYLRRKLGIIFQDFQLLTDRSVEQNLSFVLKATGWKNKELIDKRIDDVLNQVGLGTKGFKMPYELSGGEQQRIAIGRALLNDPKVILADEPTGNLDPDTSFEILELLFEIKNSGSTIFMATHNYKLIEKYPSKIIKIDNGKLIEMRA